MKRKEKIIQLIRGIIGGCILLSGLILLLYFVFVFPFQNPEMNQTQLLLANWQNYLAGLIIIFLGYLIYPPKGGPDAHA